mmetsp:Transcript_1945/g.3631  ORF Transcript_1945/g.3631 Transcript_1945/m.3631 type:complete len:318 (-) Transcript_1945:128-1081(-)|eukprot:CAMPEP_0197680422 /NCGR_PEP_ID=MMETSP1338-20131121/93307_1 /TAXON_ID=43686 ORGANISM="Pelagodinium beii, Strain RCC1491" /NCGR_SAMPLE_ID=MMETSP1338 /ASSEMBLY_ACC=CAM_ASM_000754 /LENGTH=317 /DNA_ID=CAMNT_0043261597 /DNA_START=54 /DNA_END=1007 /DNA_ORIENTATION=-
MSLRLDSPYVVVPVTDEATICFWQSSYMAVLLHLNTMMQYFMPSPLGEPCYELIDPDGVLSYLSTNASASHDIEHAKKNAQATRPTTAAPNSTGTPPASPRPVKAGTWQSPRLTTRAADGRYSPDPLTGSKLGFQHLPCNNFDLAASESATTPAATEKNADADAAANSTASTPTDTFDSILAEHCEIVENTKWLLQHPQPPLKVKRYAYKFCETAKAAMLPKDLGDHVVVGSIHDVVAAGPDATPPQHCYYCPVCYQYFACPRLSTFNRHEFQHGGAPAHGCHAGDRGVAICSECSEENDSPEHVDDMTENDIDDEY